MVFSKALDCVNRESDFEGFGAETTIDVIASFNRVLS